VIDGRLAFNPWHGLSPSPDRVYLARAQNGVPAVSGGARSLQERGPDHAFERRPNEALDTLGNGDFLLHRWLYSFAIARRFSPNSARLAAGAP
jgi:hypothetical protein